MDDDFMVCRECGDPTNRPPYPEWEGLCPSCVIKIYVLPLIADEKLRDLVELKSNEVMAISISADPDSVIRLLKGMFKIKDMRQKMRAILDEYDKQDIDEKEERIKVKQPIVRNDPRTG